MPGRLLFPFLLEEIGDGCTQATGTLHRNIPARELLAGACGG